MASRNVKNFIAGFANATLDSIQKREAYERDLQKARMLEELRTSQAKELADYQELLDRKKVSKDLTEADYTTGKRTLRNAYGEKVGELEITPGEILEYEQDKTKQELELENIRSTIESRARDDARQDRSTNAYIGSLDRQGKKDEEDVTDMDRANELLYRYKSEASEAAKSGNISESAIRMAAIEIIRNSKDGDAAQRSFLQWLNDYRTGRKHTAQRQRSLDAGIDPVGYTPPKR